MISIRDFASRHPFTFGLVVTLVFIAILIVSAVLGNLWSGESNYGQPGGIAGRLIGAVAFLAVLGGLSGLRSAGFTALGSWNAWLWSLAALVYAVLASTYAVTGRINFDLANPALSGLVILFVVAAAFLEEVTFRGLVLRGMLRAWGTTNRGVLKSILVSSLLFCSIHLFDILGGRPLLNVLLQSLGAIFLGVFLAVLVVKSKSIYPAVFFHAVYNLSAFLSFAAQDVEPAPTTWLLLGALMLPPALIGIFMLRGRSQPAGLAQAVTYPAEKKVMH